MAARDRAPTWRHEIEHQPACCHEEALRDAVRKSRLHQVPQHGRVQVVAEHDGAGVRRHAHAGYQLDNPDPRDTHQH